MIWIILIDLLILLHGFCIFLFYRNGQVYSYRQYLIDRMYQGVLQDIKEGKDWEWRHKIYSTVSYQDMMRHPFKRLDSFYPDKSFLRIGKDKVVTK